MFEKTVSFIREQFGNQDGVVPLHAPQFQGNEKKYLEKCVESTYVSSVGKYVDKLEEIVAKFTGVKHAIAVVNGTQALYISLLLAECKDETEVITQALTFVATANAIAYTGAEPVFLDVDKETLGLSPTALQRFLEDYVEVRDGKCWNKKTKKRIAACVPMHTFGHPCNIRRIKEICAEFKIPLVEDAAEIAFSI